MSGVESLSWLLEHDPANPGVRYFALRDLLGRQEGDAELDQARKQVMLTGPVPEILEAQHPEGYWLDPRNLYAGKYRSTSWQVKFLADLGADPGELRIQRACQYLLDHALASNHGFAYNSPPTPSGVVHCLNGNMLAALITFGFADDERVQAAIQWQGLAIIGEQSGFKYYKSTTAGPNFTCGVNLGQPCGWEP